MIVGGIEGVEKKSRGCGKTEEWKQNCGLYYWKVPLLEIELFIVTQTRCFSPN